MTKMTLTWLGEDELHDPLPGPSFVKWGETRFDKGRPTLIDTDKPGTTPEEKLVLKQIFLRAPTNRFFKVEQIGELKQERQSKG